MPPTVTFLGPQRRPTLDRVVAALGLTGPFAAVNAGWQERESDDGELISLLGGDATNLRLHERWLDVLEHDPEYAAAEREHLTALDELQQLYLVRLDHAVRAAYEVAQRHDGHPRTRAMAVEDALHIVRVVDATHLTRVQELRLAFLDAWRPGQRDAVARHRAEVHAVLSSSQCLAIAGGHVGELVRVLRLFDIAAHTPQQIVAWSAGAMALTSTIVLFHDRAAQGPCQPEVFDSGLGIVPGIVALPHARRRLHLDDPVRMSTLARRFAPSRCVVLDDGIQLHLGVDGSLPPDARLVAEDGRIVAAA